MHAWARGKAFHEKMTALKSAIRISQAGVSLVPEDLVFWRSFCQGLEDANAFEGGNEDWEIRVI